MFETNEQARVHSLFSLEEGTHRWAYVSQTSNKEWFFVTHESHQEEDPEVRSKQQLMIPTVPILLGLASTDSDQAFVKEIQLVSPPWLNKSRQWLMEPIRTIRVVGNRYGYELENGRIYPAEFRERMSAANVVWQNGRLPDE
ncbi:hypothetical protein ACFW0H_06730 [Pseudomonas sp. CR3202]|uniref:hypothetical protein n=1 Tax=Pseudomonas sp. CR3202 TaxID=3351532 RepID=UPI003BF133C4